jgi:hypothetical protein
MSESKNVNMPSSAQPRLRDSTGFPLSNPFPQMDSEVRWPLTYRGFTQELNDAKAIFTQHIEFWSFPS